MIPSAKDLFVQALEMEPAAPAAFLAQACGEDAKLHLEVERLLVKGERADSFFGDSAGAALGANAFDASYAEKEGDVIGPYKLRQQIGEGGFGTQLLEWRRKELGPEDPQTLMAMHHLATSLQAEGRLKEAVKMQEEVLKLRRKVLGPEASGTLHTMDKLAALYQEAGRKKMQRNSGRNSRS
jgi:hypothetical protein